MTEEALEPDLAICDPHHHFWPLPTKGRYLLDEFRVDTGGGHNVIDSVYIEGASAYRSSGPQRHRSVGETDFAAELAESSTRSDGVQIAAIVGYADLYLGKQIEDVLHHHLEAGRGRFRGIRHATAWDASSDVRNNHVGSPRGLMTEQAFRQGLQVLAELGLSFDAWMYHTQLQELIDAARAVPDLTIVVDHLGGPVRIGPYKGNPSVSPEWRRALRGLAACENVYLKLGGIGMPLLGSPWHLKERPPTSIELSNFWRDDVDFCIDTFGPDRCMFESNFPIDREGCSYLVLWNAFKRITENRSASDKAQLFRGTAVRAYRLPDTPSRTGEISNHPTAVGMSFH